ncbi:hypothetical protein BSKO_00254 [Bryopsis sp. KO-2023]|nr:hypothetical protein BSKO_00254 [Bryopsis sp. KO-2023]
MSEKGISVREFIRTTRMLEWSVRYPKPTVQPRTKKWFDAARRKCISTKEVVDKNSINHNAPRRSIDTMCPGRKSKGVSDTMGVVREVVQEVSLSGFYDVTCELGRGTYGTVYRGTEKSSGNDVAIKEIRSKRRGVGSGGAKLEASIMSQLQDCPSVVGMRTFIDDDLVAGGPKAKTSYIVMDLCGGGDLQDFIAAHSPLREDQVVAIVTEVVGVLKQCHLHKILHGDVKAANFVIDSTTSRRLLRSNPSLLQTGWLKAIDFGTCRHIGVGHVSQALGTPTHWSPEVFCKRASTPADMWSLGTLAYSLLAGRHPFWSAEEEGSMRTTTDLLRAILSRSPDFDDPALKSCSQTGVDFLQRLLVKDGSLRMSVEDAARHPWLSTDSSNLVPVHPPL